MWFVGEASLHEVVFWGQQRALGPMYAGGIIDLYDAQFHEEARVEVDAAGLVLSRVVFRGSVEVRVLRARVEASETTFRGRATIAALDEARRPEPREKRSGEKLEQAHGAVASLRSLRRTDVSMLTIAGVLIDDARFAGAQGLERLRLIDTKRFEEHRGRQRVAEERLLDKRDAVVTPDEERMGHPDVTAEQVSEIYRSLRKSREDSADAPGGNDLYVGEQLMRHRWLREREQQTGEPGRGAGC